MRATTIRFSGSLGPPWLKVCDAAWSPCAGDTATRDAVAVLLDLEAVGKDVSSLIKSASRAWLDLPVLSGGTLGAAIGALRAGAADFIARDLKRKTSTPRSAERTGATRSSSGRASAIARRPKALGESAAIEQLRGRHEHQLGASLVIVGEAALARARRATCDGSAFTWTLRRGRRASIRLHSRKASCSVMKGAFSGAGRLARPARRATAARCSTTSGASRWLSRQNSFSFQERRFVRWGRTSR
jgi:hypothetical protein